MSSSVFFRFKSQKEPQRVTFDGTGISVFELKRDIISLSRLGDGTDFDFAIYNPDTNEEYGDDTTIISRGTTVIARRLPAQKPGAGRAARYVSGKMPVAAKNQHRIETSKPIISAKTASTGNGPVDANNTMTEEEKIAAMFAAGGEQWEQQQQQMANQKAIHRTGGYQKTTSVPDKPLPPGYTCHRCGEKGHWIQACPTNNDPTFDGRPKFRRTTGIPRSFLKVVEKPTALTSDGTVDVSKLPSGVMYTSTGEWVVAEPDKASWDQFQAKAKASAEKAEAMATDNQELRDRGLECPIDKRMFVDPMKTPCCGKTYCRDCIENALLGNDFICPGCASENVLVDNLIPDEEAVTNMKTFEEDKAKAKKDKEKSASPIPEKDAKSPTSQKVKSPSPKPTNPAVDGTASASVTPKAANAQPVTSDSKKRPAEEELENPRIPTGPAAMRKQNSASIPSNNDQNFIQQMNALAGLPPTQQGMGGFNMNMGFPNPMMGMPMNMNMNMMMGAGMGNPMMMNGGGFPGMGFMNGMNGGFQQNQQNQQRNMYGNGNGFNPMMQNGAYGQQWQGNSNQGWNNNNINNNHMNHMNGMNGGTQQMQQNNFSPAAQGGPEDNAYIRKPVNPHRHQARNRRQRSIDYREM